MKPMTKSNVLNIQHWHTQQGVPVYFVHTPELPMLDINVVFNAGSSRDADKPGLADLTCGLLDEGTKKLSADEIARHFDAVGANYRAGIRQDSGYVCLRSLTEPDFLNAALNTFTQVLNEPVFSKEAFERVKKQMLTGLEAGLQQPATLAQDAFYAALYPDHPYGHPLSGDIESVKQLTKEDVIDFYKRYYVTNNALIALVGDINKTQAQKIAEQIVGALPTGHMPASLQLATPAPATSKAISFPSQQTTIYLGQLSITPTDPDYFPLLVGNYTLGSGGMVSRLFHEVREQKGLVYGVHSAFMPLLARGTFSIKLQTRNEEAQNAIDLTREVVNTFVQKGPTDAELCAAQKNILGGFPLELASNSSILGQLIRIGFYKLPLDYLDTYREKIAAITTQQICAVFQKHVQLDQLVQVTVGQ